MLDFTHQLMLKDYVIIDLSKNLAVLEQRFKQDLQKRPLLPSVVDLSNLYYERKLQYKFFQTSEVVNAENINN